MPDSNVRWLEIQHTPLPKSLTTQKVCQFILLAIIKAISMPFEGISLKYAVTP